MVSPRVRLVLGIGLLAAAALPVAGQEFFGRFALPRPTSVEYDGNYAFTRIRYGTRTGGNFGWEHDYPQADQNFTAILEYISHMRANRKGSNILDLDDPRIFQNPVIYLSEPGGWTTDEAEAKSLRAFLLKGGFIIFDDFDGPGHWENWLDAIQTALPEYQPIEIDQTHPIFDTFFYIQNIYIPHPMIGARPSYFGIFENNDPSQRMMAMVAYNGDLAEYWEYAATGFFPVDPTSDSFRIGVNFFIYGMTR